MQSIRFSLLLLLLALAGPASAQELEGGWRIEAARDGGTITFSRSAGGWSYERRSRPTLREQVRIERGVAHLADGWLSTEQVSAAGIVNRLAPGPAAASDLWRGRYRLKADGSLLGVRSGPGTPGAERLVRPRPNEYFGNRLALFLDGDAFVDIRSYLNRATTSIDIQAYNWADDETGRSIAEIVIRKAREGVKVRCLLEAESRWVSRGIHIKDITRGLHLKLERAGVEFIVQNGIGNGLLRYQRDLGTHDHCKLVVVDGRYAWVGGQNFATPNEKDWLGQQVRMEGPVAQDAQRIFTEHWTRAGGKARIGAPMPSPALLGDVPAELLLRTPGVSDAVTLRHLEEIVKARSRILIATPQLHHNVIIEQLIVAAKRGVEVVVLVPEFNSDPQWMSREFLLERQNDLIRGGVEIYSYLPKPLDVKAATFDGRVAILGSAPLNGTSMDELMLCVPDARFAREVEERIFKPGLAKSKRRGLVKRGRLRRLKTRLYRAVSNRF